MDTIPRQQVSNFLNIEVLREIRTQGPKIPRDGKPRKHHKERQTERGISLKTGRESGWETREDERQGQGQKRLFGYDKDTELTVHAHVASQCK